MYACTCVGRESEKMAENGNCRVQVEIGEVSHNVDVQLHSTENETRSEVKDSKRCQMQIKQVTTDLCKEDEICVAPIEEQEEEEQEKEKRILKQQQQQQQLQQNNSQNYTTTTMITATSDIQQIDK
ncbi:hypothetical protein M0804_015134 [Polistes exclamans]|nr:hypothetical protein M0804_015135 [Polistes exclamans]KAI4473846.1 hypothetical protein M0804_015134 [Polistes exclamans]